MEIKLINARSHKGKRMLKVIMKTFIFLMCTTVFCINTKNSFSQEKVIIKKDQLVTVDYVFKIIQKQTDFNFVYPRKAFRDMPKVQLTKGEIGVTELLRKSLSGNNFSFELAKDNNILIKKNVVIGDIVKLQKIAIGGTITDESGQPLPGANILEKGTTNGTQSDFDGKFSLNVTDQNAVLVISYLGFSTNEISINGETNLSITLQEDSAKLDEIIIVGYGTQKKANLTGAVSSVDFENEATASRPLTNVSTALSGLSSGMFITQGSGNPSNNGATIRIRGTGSLNASQAPLILVDGVPNDINSINPNDVANVSVLKDASSAAIYGSRASNGVILITTKTGKDTDGKITLSYVGNAGFSKPTRLFDVITNTADHLSIINQVQINNGLAPTYPEDWIAEWRQGSQTDPVRYPNTDWWDELLKTNLIKTHTISARGGNEKMNFYNSFGILDNEGLIDNTSFTRYTLKSNLTYRVNDWLEMGGLLSARFGDADPLDIENLLGAFQASSPGVVPKHPDGRFGAAQTQGGEVAANNLVGNIEAARGENLTQEYDGKLFVNITPLEGLKISGSYFRFFYHNNRSNYNAPTTRWDFQNELIVHDNSTNPIRLSNYNERRKREVIDFNINYQKTLGDHNFSALVGYNRENFITEWFSASKQDLLSSQTPVLNAAPNVPAASGNAFDYGLRSYFGRINYDYKGKYLFEANARYDGSSRFSEDERWGFFPSFSAGWRISEEPFFEPLLNTFNHFKLRGSWGQLGNNNLDSGGRINYPWQSVYTLANYGFGDQITQGLRRNAIANDQITWETTNVLNIGVDFGLFNNFNITADYYDKFTHGILSDLPIPLVNGGVSAPFVNSAEVRNTGVELTIDFNKQFGNLQFGASINGTYNSNKIEKYKGDLLEPRGVGVWTEGQPIGKFWLREVDHIIQEQSEVDQLVADGYTWNGPTPGPGDYLYNDSNGDRIFDSEDRVLMGNPIPKYTYGGNISMSYKNFDLYVLFNGIANWNKYFNTLFVSNQIRTDGYLIGVRALDMWTPENRDTDVPKIYTSDGRNNIASDAFLVKADYFRLKTLQFGYTIPQQIIEKANFDQLRVYVNLENYLTFTKYPGLDPENNGVIAYPLMKTFSVGLNVKL